MREMRGVRGMRGMRGIRRIRVGKKVRGDGLGWGQDRTAKIEIMKKKINKKREIKREKKYNKNNNNPVLF